MMRAVVTDPQSKGAVRLGERELGAVGPGQAVVNVKAFSLNRGELKFAGRKPAGSAIGWDIAGTLEDGTRVVGFSAPQQGWAEQVVLDESAFASLPDEVSFETACALPVAAGTALACIDAIGAGLLGRRALITGVTGGVGGFAVKLAKLAGAHVTAQVRREEQVSVAEALGADDVVVTSDGAGLEGPFRAVIDGIGGDLLKHGVMALEKDGVAVNYGVTGSMDVSLPLGVMLGKGRAKLRGLNLYAVSEKEPPREWLGRLVSLVDSGVLSVDVDDRGSWNDIGQAADDLLERRFTGKGILHID